MIFLRYTLSYAAVIFLFVTGAVLADPRSQFEEGLVQYRSDNWEQAVSIWENLLEQGYESGPLQYNLGNAYFRLNELSKCLLAYERAAKLMPRDKDVQANLELVRLSVVDRIEAPVRLSLWNWIDTLRDSLTLRELSGLMQITGLLLAALIAARWFVSLKLRSIIRPLLFSLFIAYIVCMSWYGWRHTLDKNQYAIIMTEKADVYSGPDESSTQLFSLHEGTRILTREELTDWMRIRLADGREGWLRLKEIENI
ncbi:tetratricopeptide repeat protein [bacterium]|nr:MAG: tetratricopeptide repeat protein [bacterium]